MATPSHVRVGILGCGGFAGAHAKRLAPHPDARIVALCDVDDSIVDKYLNKHLSQYQPAPARFTDPARMYAEADLDAVFICTPHTLHFDHAMQALDHGCHVYLEKPMVTDATQGHALAEKVEQTGRFLVVGYNTPCTPAFDFIRNSIRDQRFGKLELIIGHLTQGWMNNTQGTWRQKPELSGGGQAYDSGAHLLNSLVWSVEDDIAEVFAFVDNHGTPVDINSSINIRFEAGTFASIVVSGNCPVNDSHMSFIFENGKINVHGWNGSWIEVFDGNQKLDTPPISGEPYTPDENFIDAILGRTEPRTSARNGIIQSELMDAIYESARTGQPARPKRGAGADLAQGQA